MLSSISALVLVLLPLVYAQDLDPNTVLSSLKSSKVIPDVIPAAANFTLRFPIEIVYTDKNNSHFPVTAGTNLTTNQTVNMPSFAILSNNTQIVGKPYLMAIVDPDAPTPANNTDSQFLQFLGADYISPSNINGEFILSNTSAALSEYVGPSPAPSSPPHRYVVLCYLQNSTGVKAPSNFNASDRSKFNISTFVDMVQGNNFTLLSATYFFVSANDTTGSVAANSSDGGPVATATSPPGASGSAGAGGNASGAIKLGTAVAWSAVAVLTATGALLL